MEQTKINHSLLITSIENFVEDTINRQRPWGGYWSELVDLLRELQDQYNSDLIYSPYNKAMIQLMLDLEKDLRAFQYIQNSTLEKLRFRDVKSRFRKFQIQQALLHKPICKGFFSDIISK